MPVLVTGGAGEICAHAALALDERGEREIVLEATCRAALGRRRSLAIYDEDASRRHAPGAAAVAR